MNDSWLKRLLARPSVTPKRRPPFRPRLERLEDRLTPAGTGLDPTTHFFHVGTTGDDPTSTVSLRAGINAVNAGNAIRIDFDIATGLQQVLVTKTALPPITKKVVIDGSTGPAGQQIQLMPDAAQLPPAGTSGLSFGAGSDGSSLGTLTIKGFSGDGILLNNVAFTDIGALNSQQTGRPLVVVGNTGNGVHIKGDQAHDNLIVSSFIGIEAPPAPGQVVMAQPGNKANGVLIELGANHNQIGDGTAAGRNVISANGMAGVCIDDADNNTVAGDYIGTEADGTEKRGNTAQGVLIRGVGNDNTIGGSAVVNAAGVVTVPANVISGNGSDGVEITEDDDGRPTNNTLLGNFIGTDQSGVNQLMNGRNGVNIFDSDLNHIGTTAAAGRNVISGNKFDGVLLDGDSSGNVVINASIGVGADPNPRTNSVNIGNGGNGVTFAANAESNKLKDALIKNQTTAVKKDNKRNKVFDPNAIFGNVYGIVDVDSFGTPALTSAVLSGTTLTVLGTLASTPSTQFTLEFFGNPTTDPIGHEQGEDYLGSLTLTTDALGNAAIDAMLSDAFPNDVNVTATATGVADDGGTSQFSNEEAIQVVPAPTTTTLSSSVDPSSYNQPVTFTAVVASTQGGVPTGVVTFLSGQTALGAVAVDANGNASFTTATLPIGTESITASYGGDSRYLSSVSPTLNQTVNPAATTTTLTSSADPSAYGQSVVLTAFVQGAYGGTPTGTVTFQDGNTALGTVSVTAVSGGAQATLTTSTLSVGNHSITATYSGDSDYVGGASSALTQTVQPAPTTTTVTSGANPSTAGQAVTFTATVTGGGAAATGQVTFYDGPTALGTGTLNNGAATFTTSALAAGSHTITAVYGGDANHAGSQGSMAQQVNAGGQIFTTTYLSSSSQTASYGQPVTFTVDVEHDDGGLATGTISLYDGSTLLATVATSNGGASFTISTLSVGDHSITAVYSGDANYDGSTSSPFDETIQ